jgi:methylase of polypeptide subunit release factors
VSDDTSDPRYAMMERVSLLRTLQERSYQFVTPTPATHARVLARKQEAADLRDIFGWSLPFRREIAGDDIVEMLQESGALEHRGELLASNIRVSSLGGDLFIHSAFPTTQTDAVFFGPDSYRFAEFIRAEAPKLGRREKITDFGAGTGVGAITVWKAVLPALLPAIKVPGAVIHTTTVINDINPLAIAYATANCMAAGAPGGSTHFSPGDCGALDMTFDLIVANPPYIADPAHRIYRDGGGMHGAEVSLQWAKTAVEKLDRNGVLLLYTGSAIVGGVDRFKIELERMLRARAVDVDYRELDPDVFGEELEREDYADVERIAAVGVAAVKR